RRDDRREIRPHRLGDAATDIDFDETGMPSGNLRETEQAAAAADGAEPADPPGFAGWRRWRHADRPALPIPGRHHLVLPQMDRRQIRMYRAEIVALESR